MTQAEFVRTRWGNLLMDPCEGSSAKAEAPAGGGPGTGRVGINLAHAAV